MCQYRAMRMYKHRRTFIQMNTMKTSPKKLTETQNHTFFNNYTLWQEVPVCDTSVENTLFVCPIVHIHTFLMSNCL